MDAQQRVGAVQLSARLRGVSPQVTRRLLVSEQASLAKLHAVLQVAFGWSDEHLYTFQIRGWQFGNPSRAIELALAGGAVDIPLAAFPFVINETFRYQYNLFAGDAVAKEPNGEPKLTAATRKGRSKDKLVAYHAKQVSLIIQEGCVGEEYCRRLTQRGILPPPRWRAEGCPKDYIDAYNHPKPEERKKWRARIYSEKNKIAKNPLAKTRN